MVFDRVIRRTGTPAGSVELLLLEAMRLLRDDGAKWISLGVSPLAKLEVKNDPGESLVSRWPPYFSVTFSGSIISNLCTILKASFGLLNGALPYVAFTTSGVRTIACFRF